MLANGDSDESRTPRQELGKLRRRDTAPARQKPGELLDATSIEAREVSGRPAVVGQDCKSGRIESRLPRHWRVLSVMM